VAPPTRRELVIVTLLLVFLLLVSRSNHQPALPPHSSVVNSDKHGVSTTPGHADTYQFSRARLSWGTYPVPQTKVLAHVPGRFLLPVWSYRVLTCYCRVSQAGLYLTSYISSKESSISSRTSLQKFLMLPTYTPKGFSLKTGRKRWRPGFPTTRTLESSARGRQSNYSERGLRSSMESRYALFLSTGDPNN
jgi:hypothetical protein